MAKEFSVAIVPNLGLRPRESVRGNMDYSMELRNLVPNKEGLSTPPLLYSPRWPSEPWPYPQLHRTNDSSLVILGQHYASFYDVLEGETRLAYTGTIEPAGTWQVWGIGAEQFIATNGYTVLAYTGATKLASQHVWLASVCEANGYVIAGGIGGPALTDTRLAQLFEHWKTYSKEVVSAGYEVSREWLLWIRSSDVAAPEEVLLYMLGLVSDSDDEVVRSLIERRLVGFARMPGCGAILRVEPIASRFAVYGTRGIYSFTPTEQGFTVARVHAGGVLGRGAIAGNEDHHVLVTNDCMVRKYSMNGAFTNLGFSEFVSALAIEKIVCSFHEGEGQYYIGDGTHSLVVGEEGAWESTAVPTSIALHDEQAIGFAKGSAERFEVQTCESDFGFRGLKQVRFVEVASVDIADLEVCMSYRYDSQGGYNTTSWVKGSPEGIFFLGCSFIEGSFLLRGRATSEQGKVDRIHVRFQYADGRSVRGPRVTGLEHSPEDGSVSAGL